MSFDDVRDGSFMELLCTDNLAVCDSLDEITRKNKRWKRELEGKGLKVNIEKTKGIHLLYCKKAYVSKVDPCDVCGKWFGCNAIWCIECQKWAHHCCSDVPRQVRLLLHEDVFVGCV